MSLSSILWRATAVAAVALFCLGAAPPVPMQLPAGGLAALVKAPPRPGTFRRHVAGLKDLPAELKALRTKLLKHDPVSSGLLQQLADRGDGVAEVAFAAHIEGINGPRSPSIATHYYAMAAYNGRPLAVRPLVAILQSSGTTFPPPLLKQAADAIEVQALHDNPDALKAMIGFYGPGGLFGENIGLPRGILARSAAKGNAQSALTLAMNYIGNDDNIADGDRAKALEYLAMATSAPDPGNRAIAENLIRLLGGDVPKPLEAKL